MPTALPLTRRLLTAGAPRYPVACRALVHLDRRGGTGTQHWGELAPMLAAEPPGTLSLDVFDTVLMRPVVGDSAMLWLVGAKLVQRGLWSKSVASFVEARQRATRGHRYPSLEDIYAHGALAELDSELGPKVESMVEAELITAVPGAPEALSQLRGVGISVVFVSDMHLSRTTLRSMLRAQGLAEDDDQVIVSCEAAASKADGTLFDRLRCRRQPVVHVGNSLWADVAMAEGAGVRGVAITSGEANRFEKLMARQAGTLGPVVAGAARRARLERGELKAGELDAVSARAWDLGADVAGQCFTAFLLWARDVCAEEGIDQVTFLARDGELLLRMAQAMPPDHWEGMTLSYLHSSRRAWTLAAAASVGIDTWFKVGSADQDSFLHHSRHRQPLASLLDRVALEPDAELAGRLARLDPDEPLPAEAVADWEELLASPRLRDHVAAAASVRRKLVFDHLRREGLARGRVALVDVGWRGQLAWLVSALVHDVSGAEPVHLHFGAMEPIVQPDGRTDIRRFAFDDITVAPPMPNAVSCVETFTASGKARAVNFERGPDGEVDLVFANPVPQVSEGARRYLWQGAQATARALPTRATLDQWHLDWGALDAEVRAVLTEFWERPDGLDAQVGAELWFESDDAGDVVGPVAARYRLGELLGRSVVPRHWRQASLCLTPVPLRQAARLYFTLRRR